ncbi:MAG: hypothetical protein US24_C0006G0005 [candidate division WS6 bacterium GW2011_GWC2_36_7]|uniref:Uncharacterized protein n=2 Tax=Candidatus Dojkabacteria TaxID=74243 RepID=A0A0G0FNA2_9BACT|nr:MAG: hypothetical protein US24_C0006G0005 [candidate division WS6 bacterium GW2011_GWC2_36_7]KKQ15215.1 MAG: hypothetical protein US29_C0048G0003 [candidate division WS6 bacterium GW2011_GWF1_36_8]
MPNMEKRKKRILIIVIGIFVIALVVTLYFVYKSQTSPYPKEAIPQDSLNSTTETIDLGNTEIEASNGYLYSVSKTVMLDKVIEFAKSISPKAVQTINEKGSYYEWRNGEDYVIYELEQNTVIFAIKQGITWNEASINGYSFTQFVNNYFGKNWTYSISTSAKQPTGETIYYAKRTIEDLNVEMVLNNQSTDYLATKDGKIVYGKILLSELTKVGEKLPLISSSDLDKYVNLSSYPKEIYPNYGPLQTTILNSVDYKSEDFDTIAKTLTNCKSNSSSIIYLYKSLNQGNLTPVYKLDLQCELTYKDTVYTIPAIGYVNAIDPQYISTVE